MHSSLCLAMLLLSMSLPSCGKKIGPSSDIETTMMKATRYMVENISTEGGYLWYYLPDLSRRWGEMEAYEKMIWLQHPGTVSMGHTFLDAYHATGDSYYYHAADKAAAAIVRGQRPEGGWNYMVDFAGDESIRRWYQSIGQNGWRLEEFQHFQDNSTFDDKVTADAARFLLRIFLEKGNPIYQAALQRVIDFVLKSQYENGGWPQRYPPHLDEDGAIDYSSFYTFNDDVIWENIHFLVQCYQNLSTGDYRDPIRRGMDFFLLSQHESGGWAQQYDMDMKPAAARSYEPRALLPGTTAKNITLLLRFSELTGDAKYLEAIPKALRWLERTRLPDISTVSGRYSHPTFVEPESNKALFVHRKGSNVKYGYYFVDHRDTLLLGHYSGKTNIDLTKLSEWYHSQMMASERWTHRDELIDSDQYFHLNKRGQKDRLEPGIVQEIMKDLDVAGRWLTTGAMISHPHIGNGRKRELTDDYASTNVGDHTDTSPFRDTSNQLYISTSVYIDRMQVLMDALDEFGNSVDK